MMRCCVSLKQAVAMPGLGSTEFVLSITNVSAVFLQIGKRDFIAECFIHL